MFNLFKPRDKGTEPIELFEYCAKRQLSGFSLLTYLAVIARHQGGVDSGGFRQEIFNEYFAFLLGKACWIAETNNRFSEHEFRALFGNLPYIDPRAFTNNGASQGVLALLQSFFDPRSGNESRVEGYCGNFKTEIADDRLRNYLIDALQETGWDGERWGGGPLTQADVDYILKNAFNFTMGLPSSLYDKRDHHPVVEAIFDLAMIALIREKYLAADVLWWASPSPSGGMFVFSFQRFRESSELVRQFVLQTNFPKGLRA